jgi:hypothetical protein
MQRGGEGKSDGVVEHLISLGLVEEKDFFIPRVGFVPLPPVLDPLKGIHLISFNANAIHVIADLEVKIRVVDSVGDMHERVIRRYVSGQHSAEVEKYFTKA